MKTARSRGALTRNIHLIKWVEKTAELTKPKAIHWVDGSPAEYHKLLGEMVASGSLIKLNQDLWPGCYLARSDAGDVARVEDRTFICSLSKDNAGPTNNWENPYAMRRKLKEKFNGAMRGRTMYVLPARKTSPGRAIRKNTSFTFPRPARSGLTAPAMAATRCWVRNALLCASLPTSPATKVGWRSTCSFWAWKIRKARKPTWRQPFPAPAARPISP